MIKMLLIMQSYINSNICSACVYSIAKCDQIVILQKNNNNNDNNYKSVILALIRATVILSMIRTMIIEMMIYHNSITNGCDEKR